MQKFDAREESRKQYREWLDDKIKALASKQHAQPDDVLRGKALAEEWRELEEEKKQGVLREIKAQWDVKGWWEKPPGKSSKQARKIYEAQDA